MGIGTWEIVAARSSVTAVTTLALAAGYARGRQRRVDPSAGPVALGLVAWLVIACVVTLVGVAAGVASDPAFTAMDVATAPIAYFVWFVATLVGLGVAGDLRAAARRVLARQDAAAGAIRGGTPVERSRPSGPERILGLARATLRELWPGLGDLDERTRAVERTRLAGDLHAVVLPSLRRAIAEAERGGDPDALARHLRTVDRELERLMADRWPVVLEAFGLVAALEELAEVIEADGPLAVEIDVEQAGERPPITVERAAWRVAQLALDNVVRHAAAATACISIAVDAAHLTLIIADDGRGFDGEPGAASRPGQRGLADAARRAAAVGGSLRVEPARDGGTTVRFAWPAEPSRG